MSQWVSVEHRWKSIKTGRERGGVAERVQEAGLSERFSYLLDVSPCRLPYTERRPPLECEGDGTP